MYMLHIFGEEGGGWSILAIPRINSDTKHFSGHI